jgi:hypothetical protein
MEKINLLYSTVAFIMAMVVALYVVQKQKNEILFLYRHKKPNDKGERDFTFIGTRQIEGELNVKYYLKNLINYILIFHLLLIFIVLLGSLGGFLLTPSKYIFNSIMSLF